jgi:hypothetical protein
MQPDGAPSENPEQSNIGKGLAKERQVTVEEAT